APGIEPCFKDRSRQDAGAPGIEPCFKESRSYTNEVAVTLAEEFAHETNQQLLAKFRGAIFFSLAIEAIECNSEEICEALGKASNEAKRKLDASKKEPFRGHLAEVFKVAQAFKSECEFCRVDQQKLKSRQFNRTEFAVCNICDELIAHYSNFTQGPETSNTTSNAIGSEGEKTPPSEKGIQALSRSAPWSKKGHEYNKDLTGVFHFNIGDGLNSTSARRLQERIKNDRQAPIAPFVEIYGLLQKAIGLVIQNDKQHQNNIREADFAIIQSDSKDLIVCGRFFALLDLAAHFEELLSKKYPELTSYVAGVTNESIASPIVLRLQQVFRLTNQSRLVGDKILSVKFSDAENLSSFTFSEWRVQISMLLASIRAFDHLNALGFTFWDYLLDRARTGDYSIYELMYKIARREETHSELRKSGRWKEFKKEIFLALSSQSENQKHKRAMLIAALAWHLHQKKSQHAPSSPKELIRLGRN
ncbi:MAG: hypothetical protein K2X77_01215, partial [Candidatus Obscuribacterales bacterium]|nr:hypothetical protein [Candidatus Obscuribacterales bacterium]